MLISPGLRSAAIDLGLAAMTATNVDRAAAWIDRRVGTILVLHRVLPEADRLTGPGARLAVTPATLLLTVDAAMRAGYEPVGMDEIAGRIAAPRRGTPFFAVTFDDGYRDTLDHAAPILQARGVPFTVYAVPRFADRQGMPWWLVVEAAAASGCDLAVWAAAAGRRPKLKARPDGDADVLVAAMRSMASEKRRDMAYALAAWAGIDVPALVDRHFLDWHGLARLADVPGCTIGSHTMSHPVLSQLPTDLAATEISESRVELERRLGCPVRHLAYPHGDAGACGRREADLARSAGYVTAVTTRPSPVHAGHVAETTTLPRLGVNRHWRDRRTAEALLGGALTIAGAIGRNTSRRAKGEGGS